MSVKRSEFEVRLNTPQARKETSQEEARMTAVETRLRRLENHWSMGRDV
jgi:hypothetical protein